MIVYAMVYDTSAKAYVEADGALLGAFDKNGECRGVTEIMEGPAGRLFQLSVGVESETEKGIVLKVWNPTTGETIEIGETVGCNAEKQIGQIFEPIRFEVGALELEVSVKEGWNWIATGLVPADGKVGAVLAGLTFANNDVIKGVKSTATYYNGAWYPASFVVEAGKAYMLKKNAGGEESFVVSGEAMANGVAVVSGWNWIGSTLTAQESVNALAHSAGFTNNDVIKSVKGSATYYNGKWYPDTFKLDPGVGYKLKVAKAGTVSVVESKAKTVKLAAFRTAPLTASAAPTYDPVAQEDTMIVYATVLGVDGKEIESNGSFLAAFSASGECRGVTEIMEGPLGNLYQLSVGVASASEKGFVLKVWDAGARRLLDVEEAVDCNAEKQIGMIFEPVVYHAKASTSTEATQTTEVPVPFAWLKAKYPELTDAASCEAKAMAIAANGVNTVWECYVIGLEPTAAEAKFEATIEMVGGVPKVTWSPDLGAERTYRVVGSKDLKVWIDMTDETMHLYDFFKVMVEIP